MITNHRLDTSAAAPRRRIPIDFTSPPPNDMVEPLRRPTRRTRRFESRAAVRRCPMTSTLSIGGRITLALFFTACPLLAGCPDPESEFDAFGERFSSIGPPAGQGGGDAGADGGDAGACTPPAAGTV